MVKRKFVICPSMGRIPHENRPDERKTEQKIHPTRLNILSSSLLHVLFCFSFRLVCFSAKSIRKHVIPLELLKVFLFVIVVSIAAPSLCARNFHAIRWNNSSGCIAKWWAVRCTCVFIVKMCAEWEKARDLVCIQCFGYEQKSIIINFCVCMCGWLTEWVAHTQVAQ